MRRIAITAAALLTAACAGTTTWAPDYYEISPFWGTSEFNTSPLREFETTGVLLTAGWNAQARRQYRETRTLEAARHAQAAADLEAMRELEESRHAQTVAHRETMRGLAIGHLANDAGVSSSAVQDALDAHDKTHGLEDEDEPGGAGGALEGLGKGLADKPETVEEAWAGLIWILGFVALGLIVVLLHVTGVLRFIVKLLPRLGKPAE